MKFTPEKCRIPDNPMQPFIDVEEIWEHLNAGKPDRKKVLEVIAKSLNKQRLTLGETAILINATDPELIDLIKKGAKKLKENIYGNRIVLFAPLYIGNKCSNNCLYCGFRSTNTSSVRKTLSRNEIVNEVMALENDGQKRLILVYGEHKDYSPEYIADSVKTVYSVKQGHGEIRRVNVNAAPLDIEGFKTVKNAAIGTYQVFQETYHPLAYKKYHQGGKKSDFNWRLTSLDRAMEAGIDDVGIGMLAGLYDWRFDVMSMVRHTNHLEACYNIGPHTISFPRIQDASSLNISDEYLVSDEDFVRLIAILRLAIPYTGLILTARENAKVRTEVMHYGVSQIDGGTKIEIGGYSSTLNQTQDLNKEQFKINDDRSLGEIIDELINTGYMPSFCTACYRKGRTGEHFMEFSVPGFIKRFCTPNAILTLAEYLMDYAGPELQNKGWKAIEKEVSDLSTHGSIEEINNRLEQIKQGKRDIYF